LTLRIWIATLRSGTGVCTAAGAGVAIPEQGGSVGILLGILRRVALHELLHDAWSVYAWASEARFRQSGSGAGS